MAEIKWKSKEEIDEAIAQAEREAMLPTPEERIAMLEEVIIFMTMEGLEG